MSKFGFQPRGSRPGWRRVVYLMAMWALLAACNGANVHTLNIQTAASGTLTEAQQVVALVYSQGPAAEIDKLLYSGGDLTRAVKRIHARFPQLKPWLDDGVVGNTASGFLALRDAGHRDELRELIRQENYDRALLYTQASVGVGHGSDDLNAWLPYASSSFGKEWIAQSPPGWWSQDEAGAWSRK